MKKLIIFVSVILALSMFTPSTGFAEPTHPNEVGLYMTSDGLGETGTFVYGTPVTAYLVLTRPTDTETGIPYPTINFFECQLNFNPTGTIFWLNVIYPVDAVNIGETGNIHLGYLEYIVEFAYDFPVTNESVELVAITFMHTHQDVIEVTLGPTSAPGIADQMAFQSVDGDLRVMYSMGGCPECPVFLFEGLAIAVEDESFGSVKALYR